MVPDVNVQESLQDADIVKVGRIHVISWDVPEFLGLNHICQEQIPQGNSQDSQKLEPEASHHSKQRIRNSKNWNMC